MQEYYSLNGFSVSFHHKYVFCGTKPSLNFSICGSDNLKTVNRTKMKLLNHRRSHLLPVFLDLSSFSVKRL